MKIFLYSTLAISMLCFLACTSKVNTETINENEMPDKPTISEFDGAMKDFSMYPETKEGMKRYVIRLPKKDNEFNYSVEVFAGKTMEVDCNNHSITGKLNEVFIEGWGYSYLEFPKDYQVIGTLRGCPDNTKRTLFVRSGSFTHHYNSRLPIIVYVPEDLQVKYSLWTRGATEYEAEDLK